jgi:hypothetical protein
MATALSELQGWFASAMTQAGGVPDSESVESLLRRGPILSAAECLRIYNHGYFARLIECLVDDYPALAHALGEDSFSSLARDYILHTPSRSPSLNAYGQHLPAFCRERAEPWAAFASDLARLEWALVVAVHSPAPEGMAPGALAAIPASAWQTARLIPSPALRVLRFEHPVGAYFQQFRDDAAAPGLPEPRRSATAVCRQSLTLWRVELTLEAAGLLEDLVAGVALGSAVAALELQTNDAAARAELAQALPAWLGTWVSSGFFVSVESSEIGGAP